MDNRLAGGVGLPGRAGIDPDPGRDDGGPGRGMRRGPVRGSGHRETAPADRAEGRPVFRGGQRHEGGDVRERQGGAGLVEI